MDSLPYDNLEQLARCLQATFSGGNEEIKTATEILQKMGKDVIRFTNSLTNLIMSEHTNENIIKIKNSACLALSTMFTDLAKSEIVSNEEKAFMVEAILNTIFTRNVALALKLTLQSALETLYEMDIDNDLREKSLLIVKEKLDQGSIEDYASAFLVLQCAIKPPRTFKDSLSTWFLALRDSLIHSCNNLINGIASEIKEAMASQNPSEKFANVFFGLKILKIWVSTLKLFIDLLGRQISKKNKTICTTYIQNVTCQQAVVEALSTILTLQIPTEKQLQQCLFSTSGVTGVDQALNGVKAQVLRCFNKVLEFVFRSKAMLNTNINKFFGFASQPGVQGVLQSVLMLCESPSITLEEAMMDQDLQDCMVECLIFLSHLVSYNLLYPIFSGYYKRLMMSVCLPLLRSSPSELEKFQNNPQDFVSIAVDTCDEQKSKIAKTQAAKLLERVCDTVDGAVTFMTIVALEILEYSLVYNSEVIPEKYHRLIEYKDSLFIAKTDARVRIETCLLVLASLSYLIFKRKDLIEQVEAFFANYREFFYSDKTDVLIKARMCLFVSYHFEVIFQHPSQRELLVLQLRFVVEALGLHEQGHRAVAEQAVDALCNIFVQENLRPKLGPYIEEIIEKLASYVTIAENAEFFDVIEQLFTSYKKHLLKKSSLIDPVIEGMVKRVQIECESKKTEKLILNKVWNILKDISEDTAFIPQHQENIEKIMSPLFAYLENEERAPFEDDLMFFVTNVTKISKKVSPSSWRVFSAFPAIFMRSKKLLTPIFPALNQIIMHGKATLSKDSSSLQSLVEMAIQGLNPTHKYSSEANVCEAALLMQLIFQYLGGISNRDWERMLMECIEKLKFAKRGFLKTKLGGVFLCAFVANFELTWSIINNQNMMPTLLTLYLDEAASFNHPYDRKILLIGLSALVVQGINDGAIFQRLFQIFNVLISFLKYIEYSDQPNPEDQEFKDKDKKLTPKEILQRFLVSADNGLQMKTPKRELESEEANQANTDDDNDEGNRDDDSDGNDSDGEEGCLASTDEAEAKAILDTFESDLNSKDEFVIFKEVVYSIKQNNESILREIYEQLPQNKREFLKEVLNSQRVVIEIKKGKAETEARKIVKPKARKIATNFDPNNPNNQQQ